MERIAFIGTGRMGSHMVRNLVAAGYKLCIHDKNSEKCEELIASGATWAESPQDAVSGAALTISMLGEHSDVEKLWLAPGNILDSLSPKSILVDMSSSSVYVARRLAMQASKLGVMALDAPVSGGERGAREGSLNIMVGGSSDAYDLCLPIFRVLGKTISHMGEAGNGQLCALIGNIMVAANLVGTTEALMFSIRAGMDLEEVMKATISGSAASWIFSNHFQDILDGNISPGHAVDHFKNDLAIAVSDARDLGLKLPGLELAFRLYSGLSALGPRELHYADEMLRRVGSGDTLANLEFPPGMDHGKLLGVHALYLLYAAGRV